MNASKIFRLPPLKPKQMIKDLLLHKWSAYSSAKSKIALLLMISHVKDIPIHAFVKKW